MSQSIQSFVVRCHPNHAKEDEGAPYRIKVTHVQAEQEESFNSFEDVLRYMKSSIERTNRVH
ncbi:hypothetical protein [Halobacillus hunanensis]|uniref:hypothetical protein n=1 Tax=Halobacillus hunanensis TaxID=578214 RepID=UPI0009A87963|nr:hypothetical protein [Halobacillus hunanensis]